jgi:flagellar motor protein MotB
MHSKDSIYWPPIADLFLCSFLLFLGLSVTFVTPVLYSYQKSVANGGTDVNRIKTLENEVEKLQKKLAEAVLSLHHAEEEKKRLAEASLRLQQENVSLKEVVNDLRMQGSKLQKELEDLRSQVASLEAAIKDKDSLIAGLRLKISELEMQLAAARATLENVIAGSSMQDKSLGEKDKEIARLLALLEEQKNFIEELQKQLDQAQIKLSQSEQDKNMWRGKFEKQGNLTPAVIFLTDQAEKEATGEYGGFSFKSGSAEVSSDFRDNMIQQEIMRKIVQGVGRFKADIIEIMGHTDVEPVHDNQPVAVDIDWRLGDFIRDKGLLPVKIPGEPLPGVGSNMDLGILRAIAVHHEIREKLDDLLGGPFYDRGQVARRIQDMMRSPELPAPSLIEANEVLGRLQALRFRLYSAGPCVLPIHSDYAMTGGETARPSFWYQAPSITTKPPEGFEVKDRRRRRIEIRFAQREFHQ